MKIALTFLLHGVISPLHLPKYLWRLNHQVLSSAVYPRKSFSKPKPSVENVFQEKHRMTSVVVFDMCPSHGRPQ